MKCGTALIVASCLVTGGAGARADVPREEGRFVEWLRRNWADLEKARENVRAAGTLEITFPSGGGASTRLAVEYDRSGSRQRSVVRPLDQGEGADAGGERVLIQNGEVGYELVRRSGGRRHELVDRTERGGLRDSLALHGGNYIVPATARELGELIGSPSFKVSGIERSAAGVAFRFSGKPPAGLPGEIVRGRMFLSADHAWAPADYEITYAVPGSVELSQRMTTTFGTEEGGPLVKSVRLEAVEGGNTVQVTTFDFDRYAREATPEDRFGLAAHGLGRLEAPPGGDDSNALAIGLIALGCLAILAAAAFKAAERRLAARAG